jgi:hypothetical protein
MLKAQAYGNSQINVSLGTEQYLSVKLCMLIKKQT